MARLRSEYYRESPSLLVECVLRAGGQMGVRSCENRGFVLNDFAYMGKKHKGLRSIFECMESNPEQLTFEYVLRGEFSKAKPNNDGESRTLEFSRETLSHFKEYFDQSRPIHCNGEPIVSSSFSNLCHIL
jgi:hypothetical protein